MKRIFAVVFVLGFTKSFAQLEVATGFEINKNDAIGPLVQAGYDFRLTGRLFTKFQAGYKYLHRYNDYAGATLDLSTVDFHQTLSYEVVKKRSYVLKPNVGLNYRFYNYKAEMKPPYNTLPQRAWVVGLRDHTFVLSSYDNRFRDAHHYHALGFSIQLQNQFRLTDKIWLHATPFTEFDDGGYENIGGCYVGVIFKSF